jgi:cytochrome c oxidase subunit 1
MPRRYFEYPSEFQWLHVTSTAGALVLGATMLLTLTYFAWACIWGDPAPDNPWASRAFEWRTPTPPPTHNFRRAPNFAHGAYDYTRPLEDEEAP